MPPSKTRAPSAPAKRAPSKQLAVVTAKPQGRAHSAPGKTEPHAPSKAVAVEPQAVEPQVCAPSAPAKRAPSKQLAVVTARPQVRAPSKRAAPSLSPVPSPPSPPSPPHKRGREEDEDEDFFALPEEIVEEEDFFGQSKNDQCFFFVSLHVENISAIRPLEYGLCKLLNCPSFSFANFMCYEDKSFKRFAFPSSMFASLASKELELASFVEKAKKVTLFERGHFFIGFSALQHYHTHPSPPPPSQTPHTTHHIHHLKKKRATN
ncbi:Hypothetical protein, putative, partial [Bodo saltans]